MVRLLSTRFQKTTALIILTVFYCETVLSAYTQMIATGNYVCGSFIFSGDHYHNEGNNNLKYFFPDAPAFVKRKEKSNSNTTIQLKRKDKNNNADYDIILHGSGPSQPEMQTFKSVNSDEMVDLFTGDFSYNIPLLDVGGYPVNLFYRSGITMDQEASWVGLGWNINPGTISRSMRGLPDDFDGGNDVITKTSTIKNNNTIGVNVGADIEIVGLEKLLDSALNFGAHIGVFHNNYKGYGIESGINASINAGKFGMPNLSAGLSVTNNSQDGLTLTPSLSYNLTSKYNDDDKATTGNVSTSLSYNTRSGLKSLQITGGINETDRRQVHIEENCKLYTIYTNAGSGPELSLFSSGLSFMSPAYTPTISLPFTNRQISFLVKVGGEIMPAHLPNAYISGYYATNRIDPGDMTLSLPAYGYLNYQDGASNNTALLDFNREKEIPYREKPAVPNIAVPSYTYDLFTISGEGNGGMFRAYRGDMGFIFDHAMGTKSESDALSADLGFGDVFHGGIDLDENYAESHSGQWIENNALRNSIAFRHSDSTFEASYFRNPGEKTSVSKDFYDALGGDDVVTPLLAQSSISSSAIIATNYLNRYRNKQNIGTVTLSPSNTFHKRDKRMQVISYLKASDAAKYGVSKYIENYPLNKWTNSCNTIFSDNGDANKIALEERTNSFRQGNHISEITVLNGDGKRYIYGLPVYNLSESDVTFSIDGRGTSSDGLVKYTKNSDDVANPNRETDRDNYFNKELIPAYAHDFLLTSILSPDYVDVTGDGISDDDLGDAIKINYSKAASVSNPYGWRTPYVKDSATYNQGLKTDYRDDRATYIYGEKELWYLNSVESKNMIAVFTVENRNDLRPSDTSGEKLTDNPAKRLKQIDLYTKSDYIKNGTQAKPIKTVHFTYGYDLCKGINRYRNSSGQLVETDSGKLTLKEVWFSYNGSTKKENSYKFFYNGLNPTYNTKSYDRWGSYKDPAQNPVANETNEEYPYALQDSITAAQNAAAWTLDSIILPSSGRIKVTYESDDYGYVQNKRAMQMFQVVGLGSENNPLLYTPGNADGGNLKIYAKVSSSVSSNTDVYQKYLQGIDKVFFRLSVKMPYDSYGAGNEFVPCYADIDLSGGAGVSYGTVTGNDKRIWFKIKGINLSADGDGAYSPLAKAAIQYLRLNLPSKAYPGSEVGDKVSINEAIMMVFSQITNVTEAFSSYDKTAMHNGWASFIDTNKTLVRLNVPGYKKYGGGLRVKKIKIYDNWNVMTSDPNTQNGQRQSVYGQEYTYTTVKEINGTPTTISSGVASYEPMIGGEENPWRQPLEYTERVSALAPTSMGYTETPLGEGFFPAASVGYSQVRVRSINYKNVKSANGIEETRFFTTYDFPTITDYTMLADNKKRYKPAIANFLRINAEHYLAASQGFKIELNDMNGKIRSQATYGVTDTIYPISYTENFYKVDDQNAETKHLNNTVSVVNQSGIIDDQGMIGKDVEIMTDMREQHSISDGNNFQVNTDFFLAGILPINLPSLWFMPQREEDLFRSVAMTKVIQRYGILDSVVVIDKGSKIYTKNLLYDSETGDVLLTRTMNQFNDPVYNFTYPAHWAYSGMGQAYKNIQAVFTSDSHTVNNITISNGTLSGVSKYPGMINYFESGDEIWATGKEKTGETTGSSNCGHSDSVCAQNIYSDTKTEKLIWAVDAKKIDPNNTAGMLFIDRDGNPYSAEELDLKIIRSGKRNESAMPVGTISCLNNPIKTVSGQLKLVLDTSANVLATAAVNFKDYWMVKDAIFIKDSTATVMQRDTATLTPSSTIKRYFNYIDNDYFEKTTTNANYVGSSFDYVHYTGGCHSKTDKNKSLLKFDFSSIPTTAVVNTATITFVPKTPGNDFDTLYHSPNCGDTYDWGSATTYYKGQSNSSLKRITSSWNNSTVYNLIQSTTDNAVNIYSSSYAGKDCKNLIQDVLNTNSRYYGLVFELNKTTNDGNSDQTDYLVFDKNPTLVIDYSKPVTETYKVCYSAVTQSKINPYVTGIFGNWRSDKSFVYYGERKQSDPSVATNTRTDGVIKDYLPYWSFSGSYLQPTSDTSTWVWNSQTTLFNKKGFELENKDPLGRYNSGQYGYNETMPISVVQNSKYREQLFDGFEDYNYDNTGCESPCSKPRYSDFVTAGGSLDTNVAHTGKYSLKVSYGTDAIVNIPVVSTDTTPEMKINTPQYPILDTIVNPNGSGLDTQYNGSGQIISLEGTLQPNLSGEYTITSKVYCKSNYSLDCSMTFTVGDHDTVQHCSLANLSQSCQIPFTITVPLIAGKPYYYSITGSGNYFDPVFIYDSRPVWYASPCVDTDWVPDANIYPDRLIAQSQTRSDSLVAATVTYDTVKTCPKFTGITTDSSMLVSPFTLTKGGKYLFSAWVKEDTTCTCQSYTNNEVQVIITNDNWDTTINASPSGNIIDGWQRYEFAFNDSSNTKSIVLKLRSLSAGTNVHFDDVRILPFNGNMKSFVYDPVNLRLVAELDENNYATFYEYDDEGTLIRIKKETERGVMTIQETRSYLTK